MCLILLAVFFSLGSGQNSYGFLFPKSPSESRDSDNFPSIKLDNPVQSAFDEPFQPFFSKPTSSINSGWDIKINPDVTRSSNGIRCCKTEIKFGSCVPDDVFGNPIYKKCKKEEVLDARSGVIKSVTRSGSLLSSLWDNGCVTNSNVFQKTTTCFCSTDWCNGQEKTSANCILETTTKGWSRPEVATARPFGWDRKIKAEVTTRSFGGSIPETTTKKFGWSRPVTTESSKGIRCCKTEIKFGSCVPDDFFGLFKKCKKVEVQDTWSGVIKSVTRSGSLSSLLDNECVTNNNGFQRTITCYCSTDLCNGQRTITAYPLSILAILILSKYLFFVFS